MEAKNIEFSHFSLFIPEHQTGEFTQSIYWYTAEKGLVVRNWTVSFWHGTNKVQLNIRKLGKSENKSPVLPRQECMWQILVIPADYSALRFKTADKCFHLSGSLVFTKLIWENIQISHPPVTKLSLKETENIK